MVLIDGPRRHESITPFICYDTDGMPPRLKICSIDILGNARDREVVDASCLFVFWISFQYSVRNFGSQQVMPQCGRRLFMLCFEQAFCGGFEWSFHM